VIVVATRESHGWIEHVAMSRSRDRLIARLKRADRFGRFRAFFAMGPGDPPREIVIHSKVVVVDDRFLRIGSSNMNNRSRGLDSECDLAIEASDSAVARAIEALRNRLLAEHVGVAPELFGAQVARLGSVVTAVDSFNGGPRRLCPFEIDEAQPLPEALPGSSLLDPDEPISLDYLWRTIAR
jgi:phosphatidylserine/phosphatidylglycerophosphate/cardiolipin synthase-like enzyme